MRRVIQSLANSAGYRIEKIRPMLPGPYIRIAALVFGVVNKMKGGRVNFIQVGAHDGQTQDPLYDWIIRNPWQGVLVEPQPRFQAALKQLHASRPQIAIEQAVVARETGSAELWTLGDLPETPFTTSLFASLDREVVEGNAKRYQPQYADRLTPITVDAYTLSDLMAKHAMRELDLLQIDVEGYDFEIIKMIDFAEYRPLAINYEFVNLSMDDRYACRRHLAQFGYSFADNELGDTIACQESVLDAII